MNLKKVKVKVRKLHNASPSICWQKNVSYSICTIIFNRLAQKPKNLMIITIKFCIWMQNVIVKKWFQINNFEWIPWDIIFIFLSQYNKYCYKHLFRSICQVIGKKLFLTILIICKSYVKRKYIMSKGNRMKLFVLNYFSSRLFIIFHY